MKLQATFIGRDAHGHYLLRDVTGDLCRDHFFVNGKHNYLPQFPEGTRISFEARLRTMYGGRKRITDISNVEVMQ